ncbi:MAG: hypothetical protein Q9217_002840 [Psora testacea]
MPTTEISANSTSQNIRRMQEADTQDKTHKEPANVGEVVEARKKAQNERDNNINYNPYQVHPGASTLAPMIE